MANCAREKGPIKTLVLATRNGGRCPLYIAVSIGGGEGGLILPLRIGAINAMWSTEATITCFLCRIKIAKHLRSYYTALRFVYTLVATFRTSIGFNFGVI